MKNKKWNRIASLVLSIVMLFTLAVPGTSVAFAAGAVFEKENLIADPGFDLPNGFVTDNAIGRWNSWQVAQAPMGGRDGSSGVQFDKRTADASLQYSIDGGSLQAGAVYIFSVYVKRTNVNETLQVGAKGYGGSEVSVPVTAAAGEWAQYSVSFTYVSGNPTLFVYSPAGSVCAAFADDAALFIDSPITRAEISSGSITVTGDQLDMSGFSAVWTSSLNPGQPKTLALTPGNGELTFDPIPAAALEQTITVILTYKGTNITLQYTIEASGEEVVPAEVSAVEVSNGSAVITLKEVPTQAPTIDSFQFELTVDGAKAAFSASNFSYDNARTVTLNFDPVSASMSAPRAVTLSVTSGGSSAAGSFTVDKGVCKTYYVSSSTGSDSNNGLSEASPFQSIEKLNTIQFVPGDRILFRSGDTFVGLFRPKGSGMEGAPIVASSYGGDIRPVIQPYAGRSFPYVLGAGGPNDSQINGTILLENVEYWEIRNLELHDPSYNENNHETSKLTIYNAGIRVVNEDQGDLTHFVFDNLYIHGFRGPGTNLGKTSGGIQFNVNIKEPDLSNAVPSCFVDVSITNCEIAFCGRSGINTLTRWGYRTVTSTGDAWPNFPGGEYNSGLTYYPNRDFYMANCSIHDIDGDGLIVDTWSNAVIENNTVYRCAIHLTKKSSAAVGMFNWNSDNVVFQYNECYANGINATRDDTLQGGSVLTGVVSQDGQGIEVDALNQNTWVQYNYLHDNSCFMMLCCFLPQYRSYNTWIRYNLSENEGYGKNASMDPMGYFYNGEYGINTEVYNNTLVLNDNTLLNGKIYLLSRPARADNVYKFYNNIFYYTGETPVQVDNWCTGGTDFRNNVFINISNAPSGNGNTAADASIFAGGGTGLDAYRLTTSAYDGKGASLPSMRDGMFSGTDMAGEAVAAPGIGAFVYAG